MTTPEIIALVVVIVLAVVIAIFLAMRARSKNLQQRFGPEYDRAVLASGSKFKAEAELQRLEKRVHKYSLQPLSAADRDRFQQSWRSVQATFVDNPKRAFIDADQLLGEVMTARGYPVTDFPQRAAEISVDHASVVEHYRLGHDIALRHESGKATTEELRQGMIHYRELFDELIGAPEPARARAAKMGS